MCFTQIIDVIIGKHRSLMFEEIFLLHKSNPSHFTFLSYQLPHQRVLGFFQDPYLSDCTAGRKQQTASVLRNSYWLFTFCCFVLYFWIEKSIKKQQQQQRTTLLTHSVKPELCLAGLPDVVVDGVLQGFYPRDVRVSFNAPTLTEPNPTASIEAWNYSSTVKYASVGFKARTQALLLLYSSYCVQPHFSPLRVSYSGQTPKSSWNLDLFAEAWLLSICVCVFNHEDGCFQWRRGAFYAF